MVTVSGRATVRVTAAFAEWSVMATATLRINYVSGYGLGLGRGLGICCGSGYFQNKGWGYC